MGAESVVNVEEINLALSTVKDPEIGKPLPELKMIKSVEVTPAGHVTVGIWLTVESCPMRSKIVGLVSDAVGKVGGVTGVDVDLDVMNEGQRAELRLNVQGPKAENPFNRPESTTKIFAIASGKGGVGKSSITANLAVSLAAQGLSVGLLDADILGHSIPNLLGMTGSPTRVDNMMMPMQAHGVRVMSMLSFKPGGVTQAYAARGPIAHRALEQFITEVYWTDLDILLLDLPPGTGDIAISVAHLLPTAEIIVVTTPQQAAAEVAIRAGTIAVHTKQRVAGVIENMAAFPCPCCGEPIDVFGSGGGAIVSEQLSMILNTAVPLLGRVPFDVRLREGGDKGEPLVISEPESPAATVLRTIAQGLASKRRGLVGKSLSLSPAGR